MESEKDFESSNFDSKPLDEVESPKLTENTSYEKKIIERKVVIKTLRDIEELDESIKVYHKLTIQFRSLLGKNFDISKLDKLISKDIHFDLSHIRSEVTSSELETLSKILINSAKYLKAFSINLHSSSALSTFENFKMFFENISILEKIQKLGIDFSELTDIDDIWIDKVCEHIASLENIQSIEINLSGCNEITDDSLDFINGNLKNKEKISELVLKFSRASNIGDEGISSLRNILEETPNLRILDLNFDSTNITDESLTDLRLSLKSLPHLESLIISLSGNENISDNGIRYIKDGFITEKSLKTLSLDFSMCLRLSDMTLKYLADGINCMTSLLNLSLVLDNCNRLTDEGMKNLVQAIDNSKGIQKIKLDFSSCTKLSENCLSDLKEVKSSWKEIELGFKTCSLISNKAFSFLSLGNSSAIESLVLKLDECFKIDDSFGEILNKLLQSPSMRKLELQIPKLPKLTKTFFETMTKGINILFLESVTINISGCLKYTDESIQSFCELIKLSSKTLTKIDLDLSFLYKITDKSIADISQALSSTKSLQNVKLSCFGLENLTNNSIKNLFQSFSSLTEIEVLFSNNANFDKEVIECITKPLGTSKTLSKVDILFSNCKNIDESVIESINQKIGHIKESNVTI